jgi:hypothetical protein
MGTGRWSEALRHPAKRQASKSGVSDVGQALATLAVKSYEWAANIFKSFACHHNTVETILASVRSPGRGIRDGASVFFRRHLTLRGSVLAYRPHDESCVNSALRNMHGASL